jgi:RNase H-fold protein (predicted Holliday junction resolvase)
MNDNPIQVQIKAFVENLQATQNIPVHFEPEFMSSHQATHFQGKTAMIDASAATIILQSFLDKQKHLHE